MTRKILALLLVCLTVIAYPVGVARAGLLDELPNYVDTPEAAGLRRELKRVEQDVIAVERELSDTLEKLQKMPGGEKKMHSRLHSFALKDEIRAKKLYLEALKDVLGVQSQLGIMVCHGPYKSMTEDEQPIGEAHVCGNE